MKLSIKSALFIAALAVSNCGAMITNADNERSQQLFTEQAIKIKEKEDREELDLQKKRIVAGLFLGPAITSVCYAVLGKKFADILSFNTNTYQDICAQWSGCLKTSFWISSIMSGIGLTFLVQQVFVPEVKDQRKRKLAQAPFLPGALLAMASATAYVYGTKVRAS